MTTLALLAVSTGCLAIPAANDKITAGDLAIRIPAFASVPSSDTAGYAPLPGAQRRFGAVELRRLASRFGMSGETPIDADICIERAAAPLDPARLLEAMQRSLPGARIDIREYSRHPAPIGEIEFPRRSLQASGLWTGSVLYGKGHRFAIWARVSAQISRTEVVAVETLLSGKPIAASQVRVETIFGPPATKAAAQSLDEVVGLVPRRALAKGSAVSSAYLAQPPDIGRGDAVQVEVRQGSAKLELQATAEADGKTGERITLRNPETKRRFVARVEGKGRAVVDSGVKTGGKK